MAQHVKAQCSRNLMGSEAFTEALGVSWKLCKMEWRHGAGGDLLVRSGSKLHDFAIALA